jgi:hypothetical protein
MTIGRRIEGMPWGLASLRAPAFARNEIIQRDLENCRHFSKWIFVLKRKELEGYDGPEPPVAEEPKKQPPAIPIGAGMGDMYF